MMAVMDHYALRKYRGPETWARVRQAYLAGEPAASVARRFDVSVANLRKKASHEGWTRHAMARHFDIKPIRGASDGPPPAIGPLDLGMTGPVEPDETPAAPVDTRAALAQATRQAAALLAQGRAAEALALVRAGEALERASGAAFDPAAPDPAALADLTEALAQAQARVAELEAELGQIARDKIDELFLETDARAAKLAHQMLADTAAPFAFNAAACFHWRARVLGPEVAARDFAHAVNTGGMACELWERDGRLKSLTPPEAPINFMWNQFERECDKAVARIAAAEAQR